MKPTKKDIFEWSNHYDGGGEKPSIRKKERKKTIKVHSYSFWIQRTVSSTVKKEDEACKSAIV